MTLDCGILLARERLPAASVELVPSVVASFLPDDRDEANDEHNEQPDHVESERNRRHHSRDQQEPVRQLSELPDHSWNRYLPLPRRSL